MVPVSTQAAGAEPGLDCYLPEAGRPDAEQIVPMALLLAGQPGERGEKRRDDGKKYWRLLLL